MQFKQQSKIQMPKKGKESKKNKIRSSKELTNDIKPYKWLRQR